MPTINTQNFNETKYKKHEGNHTKIHHNQIAQNIKRLTGGQRRK